MRLACALSGWMLVACGSSNMPPATTAAGSGGAGVGAAGKPAAGGGGAPAASAGQGGRSQGGAGASSGAGAGGAAAGAAAAAGASGRAAAGGGGGGGALASGPSKCPNAEFLLCDGFEGDKIDSALWTTMQTAPALDTMHAARGSRALHMHTTATGASGLTTTKIFPVAAGRYYGRMFVYIEALPTSPQWAHWTLVGANPTQGKGEIRVGGQYDGKINRWGVGTDQGPTGDWTNLDEDPKNAVQPVPEKAWVCVEWMHDSDNDETSFYLDGVEHPSLHTTADVKHMGNADVKYEIPELGSVWVGFWNYNQNKPVTPSQFDVWIDEVAFDDARIGCDK
jgi:hypothetical protein